MLLQSEDKRVLKSSSGGAVTSSTTRLTSSWRHGLSQWLQRSRAAAAASSAALSSNNNVVGGATSRRASNSSSSAGAGVASAPISISIVSNHGHVRTLAPDSFGKMAAATTSGGVSTGETDTTGNRSSLAHSVSSATDQCSKYPVLLTDYFCYCVSSNH